MLRRVFAFALTLALLTTLFAPPADAARTSRHASLVIDVNTGAVLHNEDADAVRHPASLTKMMTLYLTFELLESGRLKMSDRITISKAAASVAPSKLDLRPGEDISVSDAIKVLVTKSANDIAVALAEKIGGSEANFIRLMNTRARELGMTKTNFRNPSGLPDREHVSSARDMATLALHLMDDYPTYYPLFSTRSFSYGKKTYRNHNTMLNTFKGVDGIKTGYTRASGFNLVTSVVRGNRHLLGVVFGGSSAASRNAEMRVLLTRALTRASTRKTRKPNLIAKLRTEPKAATRAARTPEIRVAAADPAPRPEREPRERRREKTAQTNRAVTEAEAAPQPDTANAPDARETPIQVYKVRHVPILTKPDASAPSDDSTDMESASPKDRAPSAPPLRDTRERPDETQPEPGRVRVGAAEPPALPDFVRKSLVTAEDPSTPRVPAETAARRPSSLGNQVAMLGGSDALPEPRVSNAVEPVAFAPPIVNTAPEAPRARRPDARSRNLAAEPAARIERGLPPSTLNAQASALRGNSRTSRSDAPRVAAIRASGGGYEVQIGAFGSIDDAQRALISVQDRAKRLLTGVASVTHPAMKDGHQIFRARFAGFDAERASTTCTELRRRGVDCFVMASD